MYSVSNEYKVKMLDQIQTHKLSGTVDNVPFTDADVIGVSYTNRCADKKVELGSVNIGTLKLTFLTDLLNRGDYYGKTITLSDSLYLGLDEDEEPVWESVPLGTFYIAEAVWTAAGVDITAYDVLSKLDQPFTVSQTSSKIYGYCQYIATQTGTTFGMTELECEALPNGNEVLALYEESNLETYRDLLSALAQMVGGFAYADRDGTWKLRPFDDDSVLTVPKNRRKSGSTFSDYETLYDTVQFTDAPDKMVRVFGDGNGLKMELGTQPFLQLGIYDAKERRCLNIVNTIKEMTYTPFSVSMLPAFVALDLGDVITMTDDHSGDTSVGAVMEVTWTYNKSFSVKCYGDNPNLRSGQSKTDKDISGLLNNTTQNEVTYYTFENLDDIDIPDETETTIASLAFTSAQTTTVKIMHEFIFDMLRDLGVNGGYELRYYLDEQLLPYAPRENLNAVVATTEVPIVPQPAEEPYTEGKQATIDPVECSITRDFFYVIRNVAPNQRHTWQVKIITHGITSTSIDTGNAHVVLEGQRLYGSEHFDGQIEVRENISKISLVGLGVKELTELVDVDARTALIENISENITLYDIGTVGVTSLGESIQIVKTWLPLATETHILIKTEDGKLIRVEM